MLGLAGVRTLEKMLTPFPNPLEHARLVRKGVHEMVRHPLYACLIALSFGWTMLWESWPGAVPALVQALLLEAKARRRER